MNQTDILEALDEGLILHNGGTRFWLIHPTDLPHRPVPTKAAKALIRKRQIIEFGERWIKTERLRQEILDRMNAYWSRTDGTIAWPNSCEGDLLKLTYNYLKLNDTP